MANWNEAWDTEEILCFTCKRKIIGYPNLFLNLCPDCQEIVDSETVKVNQRSGKMVEMIVRCERDNTTFSAKSESDMIDCPTCGRGYQRVLKEIEGGYIEYWESDRRLTIIETIYR